MTILCRIERPDFELTVCGAPSKAWLDWLRTAEVPLTACQLAWREVALARESLAEAPDQDVPLSEVLSEYGLSAMQSGGGLG